MTTLIQRIFEEKKIAGDIEYWHQRFDAVTSAEVEKALASPAGIYSFEKLIALISPAARDYIEQMAQTAHDLTIQRFGRGVRLYAPLYLSNYCSNSCLYCGFNKDSTGRRIRLSLNQAAAEAEIISKEGFTDILLVSSEDRDFITIEYLCELAGLLRNKFSSISIEIYQLDQQDYKKLFAAGIDGVTLYQETYNRDVYDRCHVSGTKADFTKRLSCHDHAASAGMRELGLGALLGLNDWWVETLCLAEHANYLIKQYWQSHISFSFPRLRPANKVQTEMFNSPVSDKDLARMIMALRLCFADAGLVLSTRESRGFRDGAVKLGITRISAGSKTSPGGYSSCAQATKQFEIDDDRTPAEVAQMLKANNLEAVWKDWDKGFLKV